MLSFNSTQEDILASDYKLLYWLFEIDSTYYWSTKTVPSSVYNSQAYSFRILPDTFKGIVLSAPGRESQSVQTLAETYFEISNPGNTYSTSTFDGSSVHIKLIISDGTDTELIAQWGMSVTSCVDLDQRLGFNCEDFLQLYLEGDYPNTRRVSSISPAPGDPDDDLCVPVIFGTAYIPIRSQWIGDSDGERYYIMGTTADSFSVSEIRSPREFGRSIFESGSFTFTASNETVGNITYRTLRPQIAETDSIGVYRTGVWVSGDKMVDPFFKITRSGSSTDPATIISQVLQSMGVSATDIDTAGSFAAATSVYSGWGLTFNGAFYEKRPRREVLAKLLIMCNSTLRVTDKIELHPLSLNNADSVATHTGSEIIKESFSYNNIVQEISDSASVAFQIDSEPVDELVSVTVPVKDIGDSSGADPDNINNDTLDIRWVQDSQDVQQIGILHFQRKYLGIANPSYQTKLSELGVEPDDIITVTGTRYGGPHYILAQKISINKDGSIDFDGTVYSEELDNWNDNTPDAVDIAPEYIIFDEAWAPVISGPGSTPDFGLPPAQLPGNIIVGDYSTTNYITINPISTQIVLTDDGENRVIIGYLSAGNYGIAILDPNNNTIVQIDTNNAIFAGWQLSQTQLYSTDGGSTGIVLDASSKYIAINDITFGNMGFQVQYNSGNPRLYVGDGGTNYFRYQSGTITASGLTIDSNTWDSEAEENDSSDFGIGESTPTPIMPSSNNLVLYYRFNESSGLNANDSAGNNDGTLTNMPSNAWTTGKTGNSLSFGGYLSTDAVHTGAAFLNMFRSGFSFSCWIRSNDAHGTAQQYIWGNSGFESGFRVELMGTGQIRAIYRAGDGPGSSGTFMTYNSFSDGNMSSFSHIAVVVREGSSVEVYINGIIQNYESPNDGDMSGCDMTEYSDFAQDNVVGNILEYGTIAEYAFDGEIDEVRLYNIELSANQAYGLYVNDR